MSHSLFTPLRVCLPISGGTDPRFTISGLHHRRWLPRQSSDNHRRISCPIRSSVSPAPLLDSRIEKERSDFLDVELLVKDSELDEYGVVNNVVYGSYCQRARQEFLDLVGINTYAIAGLGEAMAISDFTFKFIAPLRGGDKFVVRVRAANKSAARFIAEHYIYKLPNREPVLEAKATILWLGKNYKPVRVPSEIRSKLMEFRRQDYLY